MKSLKLLVVLLTFIYSNVNAQNVDSNGVYTNKLIGWKISVPKGWHLVDSVNVEGEIKSIESKNIGLNKKNIVPLLEFKRYKYLNFPNFSSGLETLISLSRVGVNTETDYINKLSGILKNKVLKDKKVDFKITDVKISGQNFKEASLTVENLPGGLVYLVTKRKDYMFFITYDFDNVDDKNTIRNAINTSVFD